MSSPLSWQNPPSKRYQKDLAKSGYKPDEAQSNAVKCLDELFFRLADRSSAPKGIKSLLGRLLGRENYPPLVKGVYLWGGVGRGKTYLMDTFYDALPTEKKMRTHFHRFMRRVHHELTALKEEKDPLEIVAAILAQEAEVICFDEFFVSDITDAMILANLLQALFKRGVCLVATSNIVPDGLYKDGLQRERFVPAIALLNEHMEIINVDGGVDYRLRALKQAALYYSPIEDGVNEALSDCFNKLAPDSDHVREALDIEVEGRSIRCVKEADDVVWFKFVDLCDGPRSQNDYIVLAKEFHAVIVSDVPALGESNEDQARRFIYLVDEFYDRHVKLVISAEKPIADLYGGGKLAFEFERTVSRLLEMQSEDYLTQAHRP